MKNPIDKLIEAAEQLERWARLKKAESKEYEVKQIHTTELKYIEGVEYSNPGCESGAYVTPKGNLIFYVKLNLKK